MKALNIKRYILVQSKFNCTERELTQYEPIPFDDEEKAKEALRAEFENRQRSNLGYEEISDDGLSAKIIDEEEYVVLQYDIFCIEISGAFDI